MAHASARSVETRLDVCSCQEHIDATVGGGILLLPALIFIPIGLTACGHMTPRGQFPIRLLRLRKAAQTRTYAA